MSDAASRGRRGVPPPRRARCVPGERAARRCEATQGPARDPPPLTMSASDFFSMRTSFVFLLRSSLMRCVGERVRRRGRGQHERGAALRADGAAWCGERRRAPESRFAGAT